MNSNLKIELTGDGSTTLRNTELQETYHSLHGATTESIYVFLNAGLEYWHSVNKNKSVVRVFEMGFGTGLNAALTWQWAEANCFRVEFHSIELQPLSAAVASQLLFPGIPANRILNLHQLPWGETHRLSDYYFLKKEIGDIREIPFTPSSANVIFYDAFAPSRQPELWSSLLMRKMADMISHEGLLVTYCAQGQFKRNLRAAGFEVESLPGPPGKREMVRAKLQGRE